jgi:uncharacterized protein
MADPLLFLAVAFFGVAALYTTVGHAGASGYLAMMALAGVAPVSMRPTALTLNVVVAIITVYRFGKARHFFWKGLYPFLIGSVPFAAFGGAWQWRLDWHYYALVGTVLLLSAVVLLWRAHGTGLRRDDGTVDVRPLPAVGIGALIGLLSGLTGTGGGIFLSPVLLFLGWAGPKSTAGISAPFILVNSTVALAAGSFNAQALPSDLPILIAAVIAGALLGTWLGLNKLPYKALITALALVMGLAAGKLLFAAY